MVVAAVDTKLFLASSICMCGVNLSHTHIPHICHFLSFSFNGNLLYLTGLRLMHTTELKTNSYLTFTWIFSFHEQKDLDFQVDFRPTKLCINSDAFPCFGFCRSPLSSEVVMCS